VQGSLLIQAINRHTLCWRATTPSPPPCHAPSCRAKSGRPPQSSRRNGRTTRVPVPLHPPWATTREGLLDMGGMLSVTVHYMGQRACPCIHGNAYCYIGSEVRPSAQWDHVLLLATRSPVRSKPAHSRSSVTLGCCLLTERLRRMSLGVAPEGYSESVPL